MRFLNKLSLERQKAPSLVEGSYKIPPEGPSVLAAVLWYLLVHLAQSQGLKNTPDFPAAEIGVLHVDEEALKGENKTLYSCFRALRPPLRSPPPPCFITYSHLERGHNDSAAKDPC